MKKIICLAVLLSFSVSLLSGCGAKTESTESAGAAVQTDEAAAKTDGAELKEYKAEGVGTYYFPEGFEMTFGKNEGEGLPSTYAEFKKDNIYIYSSRFGKDAYDAVGVPLPESLEDYSSRDGVRRGIPEGAEFSRDENDNLYVEYEEDGKIVWQVLKQGNEAYGTIMISAPEDEFPKNEVSVWMSKAQLD